MLPKVTIIYSESVRIHLLLARTCPVVVIIKSSDIVSIIFTGLSYWKIRIVIECYISWLQGLSNLNYFTKAVSSVNSIYSIYIYGNIIIICSLIVCIFWAGGGNWRLYVSVGERRLYNRLGDVWNTEGKIILYDQRENHWLFINYTKYLAFLCILQLYPSITTNNVDR